MFGKNNLFGATARAFSLVPESGCCSTITLNRSERKNPLTFESYAEMRDHFKDLVYSKRWKLLSSLVPVKTFALGVMSARLLDHWLKWVWKELLAITRITGDLVKAIRNCRQPAIAAVDGICAGAGAILAMASDIGVVSSICGRIAFSWNPLPYAI